MLLPIEINENVVQEVLSIPFFQVNRVHVSQLRCKLPSLTRLNNDPLCVMMDQMTVEIVEPVSARPITTPLSDFIRSMGQTSSSSSSSSSSSAESGKKYGFIEKLIDGVSIEVKRVTILIKTLGPNPSLVIGDWTPPVLKVELSDFKMVATNASWNVVDLKYALPKFDRANPVLTLYKKGTMKSLSVHLLHPLNAERYGAPPVRSNLSSHQQQQYQQQHQQQQRTQSQYRDVTIVEHVSAMIKIMHKKKAIGGKPLDAVIDVLVGDISVSLTQFDLSYVIRLLMGVQAAATRQDLIGPHIEFMKKKLSRTSSQQDKRSDSGSLNSTTPTAMSSSNNGSSRTTTALNKFLSKKPSEEEIDLDELTDETEEPDPDWVNVHGAADSTTTTPTPTPTSANATNINSPGGGSNNENDVQIRVNVILNNAKVEFKNGPISYLIELFGLNLSVISPMESIDKYIEMVVPYCHARYVDEHSRAEIVDKSQNEADIMLENIIGPKLDHPVYNETPEMLANEASQYTIDMPLWPEFMPNRSLRDSKRKRRYDSHLSNPYELGYKLKFFEEGREMVRFKFIISPATKDFVFELRVNPVQGIAHVKKLINLTEYVLGSFPDMSILPPEDKRIVFPPFIPSEGRRRKRENDRELDDEESMDEYESDDPKISFVIQVKDPSIYVPSNSQVQDFNGISELLRVSAKELTITFDPRLPRPSWANETEDSLYVPKRSGENFEFPSCNEDFTSFNRAMWEVLPVKLKFNLSQFAFDLLPSFTAPPQKIMKPLAINFDLAVNDVLLSEFNSKLPLVVIMTRLPKLDFHLTQNQCILLLDWVKTYLDDPPEISALLIKNTQQFARANHQIIQEQKRRRRGESFIGGSRTADDFTAYTDGDMSEESVMMLDRTDRELPPIFVAVKLEELALSMSLSSSNVAEIFDPNYESVEAVLASVNLVNVDFILETQALYRKLVIKTRAEALTVLSPPPRNKRPILDPSSIILAHKSFKQSQHVFYGAPKEQLHEKKEYMLLMRFEQPLHESLNRKTTRVSALYNTNFPMNPLLIFKLDGVHLGLNANSIFKFMKFLESRDNIFDTSPIEFMTKTVGQTVTVLKDSISKISEAVKDDKATPATPTTGGSSDQIGGIDIEVAQQPTTESVSNISTPDRAITPDTVDKPSTGEKKKRKRLFSSCTGRPVHPILWEVDVTNIELFVIEDKTDEKEQEKSNAVGMEIELFNIKHEPTLREGSSITADTFYSKPYSASQLLSSEFIEAPPCYPTRDYDFAMSAGARNAKFTTIAFTDSSLQRTELSDAISVALELKSDYNKPIDQRNILLQLSKRVSGTQLDNWNVHITPQLLRAIVALIRSQVDEVKQFAFLLRFIRSPTANLAEHFNKLHSEINRSQRAITRSIFSQDALAVAVRKMQIDLAEKEDALQTAIQDKLRLTTMLAESMSAQFSSRSPQSKQQSPSQKSVSSYQMLPQQSVALPVQPAVEAHTTAVAQEPKVDKEPKMTVLMEGKCSVLLMDSVHWRDVFGILMGNHLMFFTEKIALSQMRDPVARKPYLYTSMILTEESESFKTYAPEKHKDWLEPKKVLYVSNPVEVLYITTANETSMADWTRMIERTIESKRQEKEEADRLERERIEREQREEQERLEREEQERQELARKKQEEQERMDREREYDLSRGVASIATQTDFESREEELTKDQRTLRQIDDLLTQLNIVRESMQGAKDEHDTLVEKMNDLTSYVQQVKKDEEFRVENIQRKIKQEAERAKLQDELKHENAELKHKLMEKGQRVLELERALEQERNKVKRIKEEHQMVRDNMNLHVTIIEDQLSKTHSENEMLRRELEAYQSNMQPQQQQQPPRLLTRRLSTKDRTSHQRSTSDDDVNQDLKLIIQDLYQQLATKDDEIKMLRMKNIELNSRGCGEASTTRTTMTTTTMSASFVGASMTSVTSGTNNPPPGPLQQQQPPLPRAQQSSVRHASLPPLPPKKALPPPPTDKQPQNPQ